MCRGIAICNAPTVLVSKIILYFFERIGLMTSTITMDMKYILDTLWFNTPEDEITIPDGAIKSKLRKICLDSFLGIHRGVWYDPQLSNYANFLGLHKGSNVFICYMLRGEERKLINRINKKYSMSIDPNIFCLKVNTDKEVFILANTSYRCGVSVEKYNDFLYRKFTCVQHNYWIKYNIPIPVDHNYVKSPYCSTVLTLYEKNVC